MRPVDPVVRLKQEITKTGTAVAFAAEHGFSSCYISQVVTGRSPPSRRLMKALGITKRVTVQYIELEDRA